MLTDVLAFVAVLACTLFAGASIYISLVEHPARLACTTNVAATQCGPSYRRATMMQVPPRQPGGRGCRDARHHTGRVRWLLGALLILAVIPFTLVAILPTNKKLLAVDRNRSAAETRESPGDMGSPPRRAQRSQRDGRRVLRVARDNRPAVTMSARPNE